MESDGDISQGRSNWRYCGGIKRAETGDFVAQAGAFAGLVAPGPAGAG